MTRLPKLRLMIEPAPQSGAWNMAVDEVLLQSAIDDGLATLRWYTWREPTVSLGYFQRDDELLSDPRLVRLPRVRRLSGGGTLVHDRELTYSLALPASQRLFERPTELYRLVHLAFVDAFQNRGVALNLRGTTVKQSTEPVLCFSREDEHDLVLGRHKVLGSAQRRRRGAVLQHGGLLLGASMVTPELPGISDLIPAADLTNVAADVEAILTEQFADHVLVDGLTAREIEQAGNLAAVGGRDETNDKG